MERPNERHVVALTDADNFEPEEPIKKAAAMDKWEGEDEDEDVKVMCFIDCEGPAHDWQVVREQVNGEFGADAGLVCGAPSRCSPGGLASC